MDYWWIAFLLTLAVSLVLTPIARAAAARFGAVDRPDGKRKLQARPVPLWGGVAVYVSLLFGLLILAQGPLAADAGFGRLATLVAVAAGFVCLLGCIDDAWDLNSRFKLVLQIVAVLPIALGGCAVDRIVAFGVPIELGWLGVPLTIAWLVGCINALNLLDGMDGLAAVVGVSTAAMMAIIAANIGHPHVALVAIVFAGALAGFLVYNLPPASIYLGDSGSMVIGLVVGILGIQGAVKTSATLAITAPAIVMSIPFLDTLLAIVRRKLSGQSFDTADRGHIHHRLLDRGLSKWQALCVIGALSLTTGAAATAATIFRNDALAWITMLVLVVLMVRSRAFGHHELALVKMAIAAALAALVNGLSASSWKRSSPRQSQLARLSFAQAWAALVDEVAPWRAQHLQLTVTSRDHVAHEHTWHVAEDEPADGYRWSLSMTFGDGSRSQCRLSVTGCDEDSSQPWYLLRLAKVIKTFGQHWASQPELFATVQPDADPAEPENATETTPRDWRRAA